MHPYRRPNSEIRLIAKALIVIAFALFALVALVKASRAADCYMRTEPSIDNLRPHAANVGVVS